MLGGVQKAQSLVPLTPRPTSCPPDLRQFLDLPRNQSSLLYNETLTPALFASPALQQS